MQIMVLTLIALVGAMVGVYFLDGNAKYTTLYIIGWLVWGNATLMWWFIPLLKKFCNIE